MSSGGSRLRRAQKIPLQEQAREPGRSIIDLSASMFDWAKYRRTKGAIKLHLLLDHQGYLPSFAVVEELRGLKSLSRTFVLRPEPTEVWTALMHRFGLPGLPEWSVAMLRVLQENGRLTPVDGIGCAAAVITATCEDLLEWMEAGVSRGEFTFPKSNGPVRWSNGTLGEALRPELEPILTAA